MTEAVEPAPAQPRVTAWGWRALVLAVVVIGLDQASKYWIL